MSKYVAVIDIMEKGWENEPGQIKAGSILECDDWHRCPTLMYDGVAVCDEGSQMAEQCFKLIEE